ncbi:MAG: hypothetical protein AAGA29_02620 [Planctomycetota bacterium]
MPRPCRKAFTLVQLVLAVFVMAVLIRVMFHVGDSPNTYNTHSAATIHGDHGPYLAKHEKQLASLAVTPEAQEEARSLVVPLKPHHLNRERGPLLARVLRQYRPLTTDEQVEGLVDTLPPNASPSVIVILPSVEKPEVPDVEKSCSDSRATDDDENDRIECGCEEEGEG